MKDRESQRDAALVLLLGGFGCTLYTTSQFDQRLISGDFGRSILVFDLAEESSPQAILLHKASSLGDISKASGERIALPLIVRNPQLSMDLHATGSQWQNGTYILHFEAGNTTDEGYSTVASFQTELTDADPRQNYRAQCPCLYSNGNERTFFYPAELALSAELRDWPTPASIGLIRPSGSTGLELRDGTMEIPRGHRLGGDITIYNPRNITTDRYITVRYSVQETLAQQRLGLTVVSMLAAIIPPLASLRLAKKDRTRLGSIVEGAVLCAFSFALLFIVLVIANYMTSSAVGDKMVDVLPAAIVTVVVTFFVEKSKTDKAQGTRISMGRRPERPKMAKHSPRDNEGRDVEESKGM